MPSVICYRAKPQDCASLGHLYRSSPNDAGARPVPVRAGRHLCLNPSFARRGLLKSPSPVRVSLPLLLILSPEVVLLILAELPGLDILRCRTVCKLLKLFIDHSAQLRYIVEAHARGLEPLQTTTTCAQHLIQHLLARERSWTMFGSVPGIHTPLDPPPAINDDDDNDANDDPSPPEHIIYDAGRIVRCRGSHVTLWTLGPHDRVREEHVVPGLAGAGSIVMFGDRIAFAVASAVCVYSFADERVVRVLPVLRRGSLGVLRVCGDYLAALFCPERQSSGVMLWNWRTGRLIDTLHSAGAPTLSFAFLNPDEIALVRTSRSSRSAQIDVYAIKSSYTRLQSSLALPDAHPAKWYSKAEIYANDTPTLPNSETLMHDKGIVAISVKLRARLLHEPAAATLNRKLSVIFVIRKRALSHTRPIFGPTPWSEWSPNQFRILSGVRLALPLHSSPVWGNRIIALGPEPDKLSLFDFCPIGAKAALVVWKAPGTRGAGAAFSGGGGGAIAAGGISVRAALAQRARTLVRAHSFGAGEGWFEGMEIGSEGIVEQIPYVVSIRRGVSGVHSAAVDGERVVVVKSEENSHGMIVSSATSFVCSV